MQSKGAYRVGRAFNPSGNDMVDAIKSVAADFIDLIEDVAPGGSPESSAERARLKALAQTNVEEAAMWAVKAATKGERT